LRPLLYSLLRSPLAAYPAQLSHTPESHREFETHTRSQRHLGTGTSAAETWQRLAAQGRSMLTGGRTYLLAHNRWEADSQGGATAPPPTSHLGMGGPHYRRDFEVAIAVPLGVHHPGLRRHRAGLTCPRPSRLEGPSCTFQLLLQPLRLDLGARSAHARPVRRVWISAVRWPGSECVPGESCPVSESLRSKQPLREVVLEDIRVNPASDPRFP
jgi:hypothetical protein